MPLVATKTRLGPYEILALLGAGGMGEVYEARDTRLGRTVAIKMCTARFTERFEREARAISSLNHPHICALYDIGHEDSIHFLVMEYLEGETLEARLRKGPLPIDEAIRIGAQIAGALEAAHRKGIIHRDLKPGNVMLTRSGAKLLDFGLARTAEPVSFSETVGPTAAQPLTAEGTILGTFHYMSPEQLEGKETDARSDIFSFGTMLYEMVTGRKTFGGSSYASLIASIMAADPPPVSTIQPTASQALDRIVRRCLAKNPDDRWQSARDLQSELEWIAESGSKAGIPAPVAAKRRNRERMWQLAAGLAAVLLLASLVWIVARLHNEPPASAEVRFQIPAPDKLNFFYYQIPAVSPDGERIAFTAAANERDIDRLFVRPLNAATATEIPVQGLNVHYPFWSPDGRQIAFDAKGTLERVDISGGPPLTICSCNGAIGGTWNRDGVILSTNAHRLLYRVSAAGGDPKPLLPLAEGEAGQMWPEFLPDGKHYLYLSLSDRPNQQGIYVASLDSSDRKFIVATNANAAYVQSGQLLFMRGSVLMAQSFDLRSLTLGGEPRPVADHIEMAQNTVFPSANFSASPSGVLVWHRNTQSSQSLLQWVDRSGKRLSVVGEAAGYSNPALSPDNTKLAVGIRDPQTTTRDIWIFDLLRGTKTRFTFDPADDLDSIWSPDGTRIAFTSNRLGQRDIYLKPADGSSSEELLLGGQGGHKNVEDWSPDGKYLIYNYQPPGASGAHLYVLPLGDRKPVPFLNTQSSSQQGQFSPNGRWVAYRSAESGRMEVYVQGFTLDSSQSRGKWQVSVAGGELPRWRRDGKELFFHFGDGFYAVDVKTDGASFEAGVPRLLFEALTVSSSPTGGPPFVVTRDGQRLLIVAPAEKSDNAPLDVMVNWR